MIAWLRIEGDPVRLYFNDPAALPLLDAQTARHPTLLSIGEIAEDTEGQTGNVSVTIGIASRAHFDDPPIGVRAVIESDRGQEFSGIVQSVAVSAAGITLQVDQ